MKLPWTLTAYAESCIKSDWTNYTKGDLEWSEALALAIDKFARDWIADNCAGRKALEEFADTKHHNPPVPLWISMKARKALGEDG